jgi:mono/diheme cytochrome c family protein
LRARVAGIAVAGAALIAAATGCGTVGRVEESVDVSRGKELFVNGAEGKQSCGSCHTLADAGTQGRVGPNLDEAFRYARSGDDEQGFKETTIRDVVRGQIAYPVENPPTEGPGMPANLVTGDDADAVASYVASVAGLPVQGGGGTTTGGGGQAGGSTDGAEIFASVGCGSCHTLDAAGSGGTVGPNLDDAKPSVELVIDRVTNGKGAMPSFKDALNEAQIRAVAEYVSKSAAGN